MYDCRTQNVGNLYIQHKEIIMIVVVGGIKGGTGKTTIATNLTVLRSEAGKKVLLVDADEQKSTTIWVNQREALGVETKWVTIQLSGNALFTQLKKIESDYDDIIIDVGGRETRSLRASIAVANVLVIPFKPRSADLWTLPDMKEVILELLPGNPNIKCIAVINQADARGGSFPSLQENLYPFQFLLLYPL